MAEKTDRNYSDHARIINSLITCSAQNVCDKLTGEIKVLSDDLAIITCKRCNEKIEIKTRNLSSTNRQWMIGKWLTHLDSHSSRNGNKCSINFLGD